MSIAWIVFLGLGLLVGQCLCERTNVGVGALFVRSHRSQGMGRGFIDPFVRSQKLTHRPGKRTSVVE
jgi:hypothetical protein